ncbi:MAG: helix-turn-helix transcriptional regulator [Candidatus Thiodiazotropha sp. (ex Monitilora ramsayi)]|nr:helix-turn-helix transcriptional regulator [Candidatus Thiodiazotropha sp. (ex Monitilora ramsayi)]
MNIEKRTVDPTTHVGHIIDPARPVLILSEERKGAEQVTRHQHLRGQLLYAIRGVMKLTTDTGTWLVPPAQAVWIPPTVMHEVEMTQSVSLRSLYIDPAHATGLPDNCCVLRVDALLRELIVEAADIGNDYLPETPAARVMAVIVDRLQSMDRFSFHLPFTNEPRLRRIIDALAANPADSATLSEWAQHVGASERTLGRLFIRHLGLSFGQWRRRLRLLAAMDRLGQGASVTEVAFELGYGSPSAFIAMFKNNLGESPTRLFDHAGSDRPEQAGRKV